MKVYAVAEKCRLLRPDGFGDPGSAIDELVVIPRFVFTDLAAAEDMASCFNAAIGHESGGDRFVAMPLEVRPGAFVAGDTQKLPEPQKPQGPKEYIVTCTPNTEFGPIPDMAQPTPIFVPGPTSADGLAPEVQS